MASLNEFGRFTDNKSSNPNVKNESDDTLNKPDQATNKAQSAGPPGSAGMVGSKRWIKANMGQSNNNTPMNS